MLGRRVLVDELGPLRGLAGAHHEVLQLGAGVGGKGVPGVPEVVEAEVVGHPHLRPGLAPLPSEGRATERGALLSDEEEAVRLLLREPLHMAAQLGQEEVGQVHGALARSRFGVAGDPPAVGQLR